MEDFQNINPEDQDSDDQGTEEQQEELLLKNTALTLNYEGISKDIQYLIDKKIHLVTNTFKNLSGIFIALNSSPKRNTENYLPGSKKDVKNLFNLIHEEFKNTNKLIDIFLAQEMEDREDLSEEEPTA